MLTKLHILLTYNCSLKCKHCYVYSSQRAAGKISLSQISYILNEALQILGVSWIYFGGGEPFTQYPMLLKAVQRARKKGFEVGVSTNGYFARNVDTGIRFLRPLAEMGVKNLRISNDNLHYKKPETSPAKHTLEAAAKLGLPTTLVRVSFPGESQSYQDGGEIATMVIDKRLMFTGRAAETISDWKPDNDWRGFEVCPRKDLGDPDELYIDAYGYVQICPGIAIGNICEKPLHAIIKGFIPFEHDLIRYLLRQGPAGVIRNFNLQSTKKFVEPCHCCYSVRGELIDRFPEIIAPRHVYGY